MTIARLFGKSPFAPLQSHMKKVSGCIKKLTEIFEILTTGKQDKIEHLAKELSQLEHEADLTKNDIRNHLPKSLFLPIDRSQFLEILAIQDDIADKAEDIGNLLALKSLPPFNGLMETLLEFFHKNVEAFWIARQIIKEFQDLIESSFGGIEAEKVKKMVEKTSYKEHEADLLKQQILKQLFNSNEEISSQDFYLWINIIDQVGALSHISERLANRIRMILELK